MLLNEEQQGWLDAEAGAALQWAMSFNKALGEFFDARDMVPVGSAHFAPDTRSAGAVGKRLLQTLGDDGARVRIPSDLFLHQLPDGVAAALWRTPGMGRYRNGGCGKFYFRRAQ
jgi:predicted aconitase